MSIKVFLLRHAKSDWADINLADHERPLNARGRADTDRIGRYFAAVKFTPDQVYCSTARRAVQTLGSIQEAGKLEWQVQYEESLYGASAKMLLNFIHQYGLADAGASLLIVGHNPGLEDLLQILSVPGSHTPKGLPHTSMPTGCFVGLEFKGTDFSKIVAGQGTLTDFMRPKHEFKTRSD